MPHLLRGRYERLEVVGAGGQGRVVKALDHLHDRTVALKVRTVGSESDRDELLAEARILFDLPPIPQLPIVREDFFDGDDYLIVMDWVDGANLERILHVEGRPGLPPTLVLAWMADAAAALTHLHTHDPPVIHGDIKPANLILTKGGRVSLVDFGASSSATGAGRGGTPGFAAPERSSHGVTTRAADIYSLAATAFALLTGGPPTGIRPTWEGIVPTLAEQFEAVIREGLSTDPERRPATPGAFVERLRAGWADSLPTGVLTFCFTNIVGSTGLWEAQPAAMSQALVLHDKTIATAVERQGGRLIDSMAEGDSTVSVFDSPTAAVTAAIHLTRDLARVSWPGGLEIRARAAVHTGETEQRGGTYFGLAMSTAARLRNLADGGQVYLSKDTAALVRGHLPPDTTLVDLGPTRLTGHSGREPVFALAAPGVHAPPPGTDCPYPGLIAFGPDDAARYFGREAVVADLLERLRHHPFVAVIGASGSGKSSLLRAGVAPRWLGGADVVTPDTTPLLGGVDSDGDRLLVVDQFEELFTQVERASDRTAFVDALLAMRRPVAVAVRADFYGVCAAHRGLSVEIANHQVLLGPMTPDELRAAIVEPAKAAGLRVEPGLVEVLVREVEGEPGALPLLAHTLRATWEQHDGRMLTLDAYRATGGVTEAIGKTADQVLASFDATDRDIAQHLLLRLVEPGDGPDDTRRRANLTELRPAGEHDDGIDRVISALVAARLVAIDEGTVQVAHEALIREWPQLRTWLTEQRDDLRIQRQVTTAAEAWDAGGRDPSELYRGLRLARAVEWLERHPRASEVEGAFLCAGVAEEQHAQLAQARTNRRLRTLLASAVIALVLALLGGAVAVTRGRQAADSRDHADVARLAAISRSLVERQPDVGLLLAVEAHEREDSAETRSTLLAALEAHPLLDGLIYGTDSGLGTATFAPDGRTLATTTSDGSGTILWDTATRRRLATLDRGNDIILDAGISPDGQTLAAVAASFDPVSGPASHLQIWDLERRELVRHIESPAGNLTSVSFSGDGRTLLTQAGAIFDAPTQSHLMAVVWDTSTWTMRGEPWRLADEYVDDQVIAASGDGEVLAGPDRDGATVWNVMTRSARLHIPTPGGAPSGLALNSDGSILAIGLDSGEVRLVDTTTSSTLADSAADRDVAPSSLEFSHDDRMLAVSNRGGRTQLFDAKSGAALGAPLAANAAAVNDVSFSADGRYLATAGLDRTGAIWRLDGNRSIGRSLPDHGSVATELVVSRDGRYLVSGGADAKLAVRDLRSADGAVRSVPRDGEVRSVGFDGDGTHVVSGDTAGAVTVASFPDLQTQRTHVFPGAWIWATSFNPKTGVVAVAVDSHPEENAGPLEAGFVALWDPVSGREVAPRIIEEGGFPIALAWSPDGQMLAASSDNNLLRFYRPGSTYERIGDEPVIEDEKISALDFAPDGATLAVGTSSGTVRQFDLANRRPFGPPLPGLGFEVGGLAYSRDGSMLAATAVGLSTSRLWDARTGARIGEELVAGGTPFTERTMGIDHPYASRPAFSPDGQALFTPVVDGSIVRWDLRPSEWVRSACRIVGRDLTQAEWRQHLGDARYRRTCATRSS